MTTSTPTVLVAAAPTLHRAGLVALLQEQWPALRLSLTADASQVPSLVCSKTFGLLIMDELLPGLRPERVLAQLHQAHPTQRLLLLTGAKAPMPAAPLPWPGTRLLVPRQAPPRALVAALSPWLAEFRAEITENPWRGTWGVTGVFSPRELQVLGLIAADQDNAAIATKLGLSVRTVESHRRTLLQKAGTRSLIGLVVLALQKGWLKEQFFFRTQW